MNPNDIARTIGAPQQAPQGPPGGDPTQMLSMMLAQAVQKGGPQALQQIFQQISSTPQGAQAIQTIVAVLMQPTGSGMSQGGPPMPGGM